MDELKNLSKLLQRVYNGKAWHGPSIMEVLGDVTEESSVKKAGNSHSIVQLVLHMIAWRTFVTRRLQGDHEFEVSDRENFPESIQWKDALAKLQASQDRLLKAIEAIPDIQLNVVVANRKYDFYVLLHGLIHHDIYHIGQIQLIKKYL
ncbi:MAG: DinB family protein [Cyclobacteriaceae bacterium]|jgi:uncharacterized damage-inducible protein DinB|nr:DinB family protein [Cyclobacteriaceae bacterium]